MDLGALLIALIGVVIFFTGVFLLFTAAIYKGLAIALVGVGIFIFSVLVSRRVRSSRKAERAVSPDSEYSHNLEVGPDAPISAHRVALEKSGGVFEWVKIIVPPLLLLPLFKIPVDMITAVFWGAGAIAFIVSVVHLFAWGGNKLYFMARGKGDEYRLGKKLVRPAMVIILFILPVYTSVASKGAAVDYIKKTAAKVQKECIERGKCPASIKEWTSKGNPNRMRYVKYGRTHNIGYKASEDATAFEIYRRFNIDHVFVARGGVDKELSFIRIDNGTEYPQDD